MKALNTVEMASIEGGSDFWDGFCVGASIGSLFVAPPIGAVVTLGCAAYAVNEHYSE